MKSTKNKRMTVVCVLLAMILFSGAIFALVSAPVKADSFSEDDMPSLEKVFYYSDNPDCQDVCDYIEQCSGIEDITLIYNSSRDIDDFIEYYNRGDFFVSNSYVIFEMRNGFPTPAEKNGTKITDILSDVFSYMEYYGCKIMFICGTDETKFVYENEFLEYVDIHINTDTLTTFLESIIYRWQENCGTTSVSDTTFILDKNFSNIIEPEFCDQNSWFLRYYFMPFIRHVYMDEIRNLRHTNYRVLRDNNIHILCETDNGYVEMVNCIYLDDSFNYEYMEIFGNERIIAIGATWTGTEYSQSWLDGVNEFLNEYGVPRNRVKLYMYGINLNELSFGFYEKFTCRDLDFDLQILDDFLHDRELFKYDNRGGRCEVTHRPTVQGTNPWMVDILEGQGNDDYTSFVKALKFFKNGEADEYENSDKEYYENYDESWGRNDTY